MVRVIDCTLNTAYRAIYNKMVPIDSDIVEAI